MLPEYVDRVTDATRRSPKLDLGGYTLSEFNQFFAGLTTVAAAHDFLCFSWGRRQGVYPHDSAVMVRLKLEWINTLSRLSRLSEQKTITILNDLTYDPQKSIDLIIQPFVPLGHGSPWLAVAPPFPMTS